MSLHVGNIQNSETFRQNLDDIVGHLTDSSQLSKTLAVRVSQLVIGFLNGKSSEDIRHMNMFEINIIEASVEQFLLPIKVTSLMNAKSVNRASQAEAWGDEITERDLFGTLYLEVIKN